MKERVIAARTLLRPWMIGASAGLMVAAFASDAISSQSLHFERNAATPHETSAPAWRVIGPGNAHRGDDFLDLLDASGSPADAW